LFALFLPLHTGTYNLAALVRYRQLHSLHQLHTDNYEYRQRHTPSHPDRINDFHGSKYLDTEIAVQERIITMSATTLEERVTALERAHHKCPRDIEVDESMRHARSAVESLGMYSSRWAWVPEPYYTWPLERRAALLKVPSTAHLCKSLLLENKKVTDETKDFWTNPRFVMVILQYEAELSTELLTKSIRKLRPVEDRLDASSFDWRVAEPEDNDRITGYKFNSVTPLVSSGTCRALLL